MWDTVQKRETLTSSLLSTGLDINPFEDLKAPPPLLKRKDLFNDLRQYDVDTIHSYHPFQNYASRHVIEINEPTQKQITDYFRITKKRNGPPQNNNPPNV